MGLALLLSLERVGKELLRSFEEKRKGVLRKGLFWVEYESLPLGDEAAGASFMLRGAAPALSAFLAGTVGPELASPPGGD